MKRKTILTILYYGILWGMFEFVLGGYLDYINYAHNQLIMRLIGISILTLCIFRTKFTFSLILVGIVAASFKIFNIFTCGLAFTSPGIINPMISILILSGSAAIISIIIQIIALFRILRKFKIE